MFCQETLTWTLHTAPAEQALGGREMLCAWCSSTNALPEATCGCGFPSSPLKPGPGAVSGPC